MLGDNVSVVNAPSGSTFEWEVKSQITRKIIKIESNTSGVFNVSIEYNECIITCRVNGEELVMYSSSLPVMNINSQTSYYDISKESYSEVFLNLLVIRNIIMIVICILVVVVLN